MSTVQPSLCAPPPGLEEAIAARDKRFGVDTSAKRAAREKYLDQDFQPDDKSDDWLKSGKAKVFTHETVPCKRPDDDGNQEECEKRMKEQMGSVFIPLECQEKLRCC